MNGVLNSVDMQKLRRGDNETAVVGVRKSQV